LVLSLWLLCAAVGFADSFSFSTDRMTTVLAKGKEHTILTGNAVVNSGDTVIRADQIELYGNDFQYANCTGHVKVVDKKKGITLTAQNLFYDRTNDLSRVEGYAEMVDQKNQLVVKGGFLENRGKDEITIIQIGVRILKVSEGKEMACRSEFARYDRNADTLELSGMPVVYWKGDTYRAARITVNLKTDEIRLEGEVSGTVKSESGSEGTEGTKAPAPSTPGPQPKEPAQPGPGAGAAGGANGQ